MSNYPPGTSAGDPNAPWNQPEGEECEDCGGKGEVSVGFDTDECQTCHGTGYVDPPTPQEIKETKEEIDADRRLSE